jgi:hypothetical protein
MSLEELFRRDLAVVNVGLASFAEAIRETGGRAVHLDWRPPAEGDRELGMALAHLLEDPRVGEANAEAFERFLDAHPVLVGVATAGEVIPGMGERTILHAGPPIAWADMCGPMRGAVVGAALYEGWAAGREEAEALAERGEILFDANHHHGAVGPMAGIISPSMPVWIVEDRVNDTRAFSNLNEGLGRVLRFGANDESVIERLHWMADVLAPILAAALEEGGEIPIKPLVAQALHMGDECHNRNVAASSLLFRRLAPAMLRTGHRPEEVAAAIDFIVGNDHFFLNISMASAKAMADGAHGVPGSSLVTAMARNGVEFGIRLSGTGDEWFTAPAPVIDGLYFPGFGPDDANRDLGDSAIAETVGLGGFAMAAAPAIVQFVGGTAQDAIAYTREMRDVTMGPNPAFTIPALSFNGTPSGIDALRVLDSGTAPVINTGIAHREAGVGQVGAGVTRAPLECFHKAVRRLSEGMQKAAAAAG